MPPCSRAADSMPTSSSGCSAMAAPPPSERSRGDRMTDGKPLAGKVALVTGGGRGLGRAFAETLAGLGCPIGLHGLREHGPAEFGEGTTLSDTARQIGERCGVEAMPVLGDLTRMADVERVVATVEARLGPVDILLHNAGGDIAAAGGKPDPNDAATIKEADIRAVLERNLLSTIFVCQRVAASMMTRRSGRIVTLSSVAAFKGRRDGAIYATSKAGVVHYTRCLADQLRPFNVTVNSIARGIRGPDASSAAALSPPSAWSKAARSTVSRWSTRWRAWSRSSPGRWAISSPARGCASMAACNAGRDERGQPCYTRGLMASAIDKKR